MKYRKNPKNGEELSQLGLGCMRFPRKAGRIDQEKTNALVAAAIDSGVNYFDSGYIYPGSEEALGKALSACGKRDQINIVTKLPHQLCRKPEDFDKYFKIQLERLRTDHVDYYLMHMLGNVEAWERLTALGIERWLEEKRETGEIRNAGFSFHGGREKFIELLEAYDWDICMVQYNYFDENSQAGYTGVRAAYDKGLPVIVMEPLRGGLLADSLPDAAKQAFGKVDKNRTPAEWALRWVLNHREVTLALSGMSETSQLTENCSVADDAGPDTLSERELAAYTDAVAALNGIIKVPCTACGYCMPCPKGVDIPTCFNCHNESYAFGLISGITKYVQTTGQLTPVRSDATKCVACGKCEAQCPQSIRISEELVKVKRRMKTFAVKPLMGISRKVMRIG